MNETELKMIDYMQGYIDCAKEERLSDDYKTMQISKELVHSYIEAFHTCAAMFEAVTGKAVTFKDWKVVLKGE